MSVPNWNSEGLLAAIVRSVTTTSITRKSRRTTSSTSRCARRSCSAQTDGGANVIDGAASSRAGDSTGSGWGCVASSMAKV